MYLHEYVAMLWFNFILGSNFILLRFKLIIMYYCTQKQRKIKLEPRLKLNRNSYTQVFTDLHYLLLYLGVVQAVSYSEGHKINYWDASNDVFNSIKL